MNLKNITHKVNHCGNGQFYLIIVLDKSPKYEIRNTSKGHCYLNSNIFDKKTKLRKITGGGHKIHATNNSEEYYLDIKKLFGINWDILEKNSFKQNINLNKTYIPEKWDSIEAVFNFIGNSTKYLILRNFEDLEKEIFDSNSLHPDIDLLCDNPQLLIDLIGAIKTSNIKYRRQYYIFVNSKKVFLDIRGINENYYCYNFSTKMLENRKQFRSFYIPQDKDYLYSLIYHCLIHKNSISKDYVTKIFNLSRRIDLNINFNLNNDLFKLLTHFLNENNFCIVEPKDLSVFYNYKFISNYYPVDISLKRKRYNNYYKVKYGILKVIKKIIGVKMAKKIKNLFA